MPRGGQGSLRTAISAIFHWNWCRFFRIPWKLIESKVSQLPTFLKSPNKTLKSLQGREPKMCCVKDTYYFSLPSEASPNSLVTDLSGPVTQPAPKTSQELFSLELDPEHCLCFRLELWVTSSCCHTAKRPEMERKSLGILKTSSTPALPNVRFHKPWILEFKLVQVGFSPLAVRT